MKKDLPIRDCCLEEGILKIRLWREGREQNRGSGKHDKIKCLVSWIIIVNQDHVIKLLGAKVDFEKFQKWSQNFRFRVSN